MLNKKLILIGRKESLDEFLFHTIDDYSYRLIFDLGMNNEIHRHSQKGYVKTGKITKFDCEMFPYLTAFRGQTLQFYQF